MTRPSIVRPPHFRQECRTHYPASESRAFSSPTPLCVLWPLAHRRISSGFAEVREVPTLLVGLEQGSCDNLLGELSLLAGYHRRSRRDLVAHIPQILVEPMLHALLQDLDRGAHRSHDPPADDPLCQFEVVETK